ncbi:MAG: efflux RND transporter periplasmic adaptor subunit [Candidatus Eisenbacteria bacterium]
MSPRGTRAIPLIPSNLFLPRVVFLILLAIALLGLPACGRSGDGPESVAADSTGVDTTGEKADRDRSGEADRGRKRNSKSKGDDKGGSSEDESLPIEVTLVGRGRIEAVVRSATNLEAEARVVVIAEAARQVRQLFVEEGDVVEKGKVLLRLENDEQRSNLAKAQVGFDQAERELDRQKRLFEQNLAAERALNDAQHEYDRARITLEDARRELGYTEVRAPIEGTITQRFVQLGDQIGLGQQLFEIVDFESLVARVYVPEGQVAGIRPGQTARVSAEAAGDAEFLGTVDRIAPIVDPKSGTVKVTVAVGEQPGLLPGMFVDVDIVTSVHEDVVLLPKRAMVYDEDRAYAFKAAAGKASRVLVVPILADRDWVEPADGFAPGDTLVVAGQAGLKDGSKVEILAKDESAS